MSASEFGHACDLSRLRGATGLRLRRRRLRFLAAHEIASNAPGDPGGGALDGIPSKVSVPRGGLHLRVTEQLPDHREALAQGQRPRSIRMAEVVNSHVLQPGARADAAPGLL